jgi:hypothetical protein
MVERQSGSIDELFDADRRKKFPAGKKIQGGCRPQISQRTHEEINHELRELRE